jgi:Nucleotidyl transferase of unknown function (DUF2204)
MDLAPDFDEFIGSLNVHGVEFLIVGAYALAFHGAPRFTGDLDVLVRPTLENADRLLVVVREFGFDAPELTPDIVIDPRRLIQMGVEPVQIHVMSAISGVSWDDAWRTHDTVVLDGRTIPFIGRDAMLVNKRAAGRPKDLADIDALKSAGD